LQSWPPADGGHKSNAQRHAMVMWDGSLNLNEFPDVTWDKVLVDACTDRM
jgi:tartrate dehydrogenase/decarboxylase/D-malate dehydrogenase